MFTALKQMGARLRAFVRARDLDRDFEQELESHLTMLTEDNVGRGMTSDEARRAALVRVGGAASIQEQHRAVRGLPIVEAVLQDLRFAFRLISKNRSFAAAAIAVLALGIGASTVGFTILNAALFRGLPFEDSDRLHILAWDNRSGRRTDFSHAELQDLRAQSRSFTGLAAYRGETMNISDDRALPEQATGAGVTASTFGVLGQAPLLGRDFADRDERPGAEPVVIIGHGIWKNRYGGDPHVLGKTLHVNGDPATIVGVMPVGMRFPYDYEVWVPFIPTDAQKERDARVLRVFGRLRDGTDRRQAQTELSGIAQQLLAAYPDMTRNLEGVRVETFTERWIGGAGRPLLITVMGAGVFVLLIACANVANLLLSRSAYRAREMAIRTAMGATRGRVVRQLLIESAVLGLIGGSIGLVLASAGVTIFDAAIQGSLPYWVVFTVDYVVFAYVAATCVLTAILFGLAPALHVSNTNDNNMLKEGGRGQTGSRRERWFSSTMVISELALTVVLLVGAGSMVRSFVTLYSIDLGIEIDQLMAMRVELPEAKYETPEARRAFFERIEPRIAAIPGVEATALTTGVPPHDGGERLLEIDGRPRTSDRGPVFVGTVTISPRFFEVVGVRLLRGRNFHGRDGTAGAETVIINERLAAQFFPGEDPIGRRLRFTQRDPTPGTPPDTWRTIVGITPLIKQASSLDGYVNAVVYIPHRQESPAATSLLVRSPLPPGSVMDAVRREVQALDRDQPVLAIQTLAQVLAETRWWQRTWGGMFAVVAVIALVLSSVGLYAVMAYSVTQRTQEIGVRMALGAQRRQVSWLVLRRGLLQLAIGLTLGFAGSVALRPVLPGGILGITPHDPVAVAAITILLTVVSLAACLLPARWATRVDPVVALRAE
ncbi:MAG: FtsX-like permease family protein [Luteitalea sp.]|nr:FtsX-like permease family protein [Luteitalea sp.]